MRPFSISAAIAAILLAGCATEHRRFRGADRTLPFSRAVLAGDTLYLAGHLGIDPHTGKVPSDPAEEARLMLDAFAATLAEAGMSMDDLVQVQVHCSDVALYATFNAVYAARFPSESFPARAFIGSGPLLRGARFEILGTAVRR